MLLLRCRRKGMEQMKKRNAGIELLRIVLMFMVAVLHIINAGGVIDAARGANFWSLQVLKTAAFCSVNCFALISGYVGWNKRFRYHKLLSFWLQVVFYSFLITAAGKVLLPGTIATRTVLFSLIPVTSHQYWYVSSYFGLMLLMPLLNTGMQNLEKNQFTTLITLVIGLIVCMPTVFPSDAYIMSEGYSLMWLVVLYVIGGYLNKYSCLEKLSTAAAWGIFLLCVSVSVAFCGIIKYGPGILGSVWEPEALIAYTSPTILAEAVVLLSVFEKMRISDWMQKAILYLSPAAFGVYLFHVHPVIFHSVIMGISTPLAKLSVPVMLLAVLAEAFVILAAGLIVDLVRIYLFKLLKLQKLCDKAAEKVYSEN